MLKQGLVLSPLYLTQNQTDSTLKIALSGRLAGCQEIVPDTYFFYSNLNVSRSSTFNTGRKPQASSFKKPLVKEHFPFGAENFYRVPVPSLPSIPLLKTSLFPFFFF